MTAPLKHSADITVDVALGDRAYDIVIGRGVLASLGARVAALRPGVRTAIVTDRTVARHWLEPAEQSLAAVTVFDRDEIEPKQAASWSELLRRAEVGR